LAALSNTSTVSTYMRITITEISAYSPEPAHNSIP